MTRPEIAAVLAYIAADYDVTVSEQRIDVWLDQFSHLPKEVGMAAACVCLARKSFGFPRVHEFHEAVREVQLGREERDDWGAAWDAWMKLSARGRYRHDETFAEYERVCPLGARALGTMARETYDLDGPDAMNTFRAQFRQRFTALADRERVHAALNPKIQAAIVQIGEKARTKRIGSSAVKRIN